MLLTFLKGYLVMNENVRIIYQDLPCGIRGFVKKLPDEFYAIVLNSRLTREQNIHSLQHELEHIKNGDLDRDCCVQDLEFKRHYL